MVHKSAKPEPVHLPDDSIADRTRGEVRALRAENERLRANNERLLKAAYGLQDDVEALQQQRAELILKIERLRKDMEELTLILDSHRTKPTDGSLSRWVCQP